MNISFRMSFKVNPSESRKMSVNIIKSVGGWVWVLVLVWPWVPVRMGARVWYEFWVLIPSDCMIMSVIMSMNVSVSPTQIINIVKANEFDFEYDCKCEYKRDC